MDAAARGGRVSRYVEELLMHMYIYMSIYIYIYVYMLSFWGLRRGSKRKKRLPYSLGLRVLVDITPNNGE